ncbi:hypothetical protein TNCV_565011 [Trichonephila clavipes]|nr:hypothetical protein TNCV_565011 [Trichonephila clavipes]
MDASTLQMLLYETHFCIVPWITRAIVLSLATKSPARFDSVGKALSVRLHVSCQGWRDEMVWGHIPMGWGIICNPEDDPLLYGRQCTVILEWVLSWDLLRKFVFKMEGFV